MTILMEESTQMRKKFRRNLQKPLAKALKRWTKISA